MMVIQQLGVERRRKIRRIRKWGWRRRDIGRVLSGKGMRKGDRRGVALRRRSIHLEPSLSRVGVIILRLIMGRGARIKRSEQPELQMRPVGRILKGRGQGWGMEVVKKSFFVATRRASE
jgi:hypothetical protein